MRVSPADLQGSFDDFIATKAAASSPTPMPLWAQRPDTGGAATAMMAAPPAPPPAPALQSFRAVAAEPLPQVQVEEPEVPPAAETLKRHAVEVDLGDRVQVCVSHLTGVYVYTVDGHKTEGCIHLRGVYI